MRARLSSLPLLAGAFAVMGLGVMFELVRAASGVGGASLDSLSSNWVYMLVEFLAVGVCAARVLQRPEQRRAWGFITFALACWSAGDLIWAVWLDQLPSPPYPSPADGFYLLLYPAIYVALMLLIRSRLRQAAVSQWLDGGVVGLTVAAVTAALMFSDVLSVTNGRFVAEAVTVAYPVGDFILLMFVAVAYTLADWRPGRDWLVLGAGVLLMAVGDIINADQVAGGVYLDSSVLNAIYLTSFALLAAAAWVPSSRTAPHASEAPHTIALTLAAATVALGLLVLAAFTPITPLAVGLAAGSMILAATRSALTYLENVRILRSRSAEAVTDSLTGLGNRRQLMSDLENALSSSPDQHGWTLAFFDLNGFKRYNDNFGHLAGDALLTRLAFALRTAVAETGHAYRLGGDEFCILMHGRYPRDDRRVVGAASALTDHGTGFAITAATGVALLPGEASTASLALRLADERMYADKGRAHRAPTRDVLLQLLAERAPGLLDHVSGVTTLTAAVAARLHLNAEQLDETLRAAELHDIGKLAIPDEILNKPGPLSPAEWRFMKQHPIIGHRILNAAPALAPVAVLVRASHERWDGLGYPDGLAGEDIPLGARIIAACDAFDAIVSDRCYQPARSQQDALAELERNAGTQFDATVIDTICDVVAATSPPDRTLHSGTSYA